MNDVNIEYVDKLHPIFTKPKRIKIIVGGRGSTKSTAIADYVAAAMNNGQLWCCAREHQNSIEESVHRTLLDEINRVGLMGFSDTKTGITHISGGRCFYRGLARNITALKSTLSGVDGLWIEEGEDLSENTLRVLTASVRLNATDTERKIKGEDVKMPEIIITMNRGNRNGAVAQKWLARAEKTLERTGYYEDDLVMIVEMNYTDMPTEWFIQSGLEQERLDDKDKLTTAAYEHKWLGKYMDTIDRTIIQPEWFDACVDAHLELGIKPRGAKVLAHDPSDEGKDSKGIAARHGIVVTHADDWDKGDVNEGMDWALMLCDELRPDVFVWDCDGLGIGLRRQVTEALEQTHTDWVMFKGSKSPEDPDKPYDGDFDKENKTNEDVFRNRRAQYYIRLRDRIYKTYQMINKLGFYDKDELISFSSKIDKLHLLRAELCRVPTKPNPSGMIQILSKPEMAKLDIASPNMGDSVMMLMVIPRNKSAEIWVEPKVHRTLRSASRYENANRKRR